MLPVNEVLIETGRERTGIELFRWVEKVQNLGVGEIIVTEIPMEGKKKGFNLDLYEKLRKKIDVQFVAHGGAGPFDNIYELFNFCNVDAISIASLFHYHYHEPIRDKELIGSNFFSQSFKESDKTGTSIIDLKKYLISRGIKIRL